MVILNELSEYISLRMKSYFEPSHEGNWIEHKAHIDYDLWFIQSGIVNITIDGVIHTANPGDVIFLYPGVPYRASTSDMGCRFIYIHFDFEIGKQQRILNDFPLSGVISKDMIQEEFIRLGNAFYQLKLLTSLPGNRLYLKSCLMAVIAKIIELYGQGQYIGQFLNEKKFRKPTTNLDVLKPVFNYINDNLQKSIKMNELAALVGISEKYFISYFKKALGITPGQYIYQIKMNRAREYLYSKKYTVQEISNLLGYPDPFTFSKAFKKYYNVPPSKFE
ncbi:MULTISPECIES: AraC family transcriptional regulator [unclassified Paenibacillus]|uniref:AraC family transcriptional regulator n=1 Tax=unclassified Paenibacillus TaxID=185978 RepID=UPI0030FB7897